MSYMVLARKWRPKQFDDVAHQTHITRTLQNAIKMDRLSGAYLFSGPRGCGKTSTARLLAKALNCAQGPTTEPCNECSFCLEIGTGTSIDVQEIDGASNRGIDEIRNLRENIRYAPSKGKRKIFIIDEVHMLTTPAFNALLKTLEEPPPRTLFIFATTELHKIPATILSRCQHFEFRRIPAGEIDAYLRKICGAEGLRIDDKALALIARKAEGALRDALSILDQAIALCGDEIKYDELQKLLGVIDAEFFFTLSDGVRTRDVGSVLRFVDEVFTSGIDMFEVLVGAEDHFRNLLIAKTVGEGTPFDESMDLGARYSEEAQHFEELDLLRILGILADAEGAVKRSPNPKLPLEMTLARLTKMDSSIELGDLLSQLQLVKKKPEPVWAASASSAPRIEQGTQETRPRAATPSQPYQGEPEPQAVTPAVVNDSIAGAGTNGHSVTVGQDDFAAGNASLEEISEQWDEVIKRVGDYKESLGMFLNEGCPHKVAGNVLQVSFGASNGFHIDSIVRERTRIQRIIADVVGAQLSIKCLKLENGGNPDLQNAGNGAAQSNGTKVDPRAIPMVKKALEVFEADIVS